VSENTNMNNNMSTRSQVQGSNNASQWAGVHLGFYQASTRWTCILLDNESSTTIFCNPDMVTNIRQTNEELTLANNKCRSASNKYESQCSWLGWSVV
jgi:hypothetical protein